jgi:hypothetical protein
LIEGSGRCLITNGTSYTGGRIIRLSNLLSWINIEVVSIGSVSSNCVRALFNECFE